MRRTLATLLILVLAVYLLRGIIVAPWLSGQVERAIERRTGVGVTVGAIEGSWLGRIGLRGVRTVRPGVTGPFVSLEINKLAVRYAPADLLRGVDAFIGGIRIEIDGGRVVVNLAPRPGDGEAAMRLPAVLPAFQVRWLDILAERPGLSIRAGGVSMETGDSLSPVGRKLSFGATSLTVETPGMVVGPIPVAATVRPTASGFEAEVSVPGRNVQGTAVSSGGVIDVHVALEAVALGAGVVRLSEGTVTGTLSGDVRIRADKGRGLAVAGSARLEEALLRGVPVESLDLEGGYESGALRIRSLEAVSGPNRIGVRDAVLSLESLRARDAAGTLRAASGSFSARLADVPALFALAGRPLPVADRPPPHRLELEGTVGGGVVAITAGRLALPRGGVRVEHFRAVIPPVGAPWSSTRFDAGLDVDLPDVALLNRILPLPALAGSLGARVVLGGTPDTLQGSVRATARSLAVAGRAIGDLDLDAGAERGRVLVRTARLSHAGGANRLSFDGLALRAADLADRRWRALVSGASGGFAADLRDLPALFALAGSPLRGAGPSPPTHLLRLAGRIDRGTIELSAGSLSIASGRVTASRARATLPPEGRPWSATAIDLVVEADVPDLAPPAALFGLKRLGGALRGTAEAGGTLQEPEGSFAMSFADAFLGAAGPLRGRLSGTLAGGGVEVEQLNLETPQGNLALAGRLEREGSEGVRLRLGSLVLRRGGSEARLAQPALVHYAPPGTVTTDGLRVAGPQGSLTVTGKLALDGDSDLSFDVAGLGSDGWLAGLFAERVTVRGLDARGRLTGSRRSPRVLVEGSVVALSGAGAPDALAGRFDLSYEQGALTVVAFEWSDGKGLRASATGRLPVDPFAEGVLLPGVLDIKASLRAGDLRVLSFLFPASVEPRGALEADLVLGGSWEAPSAEFAARATDAGLSGIAALKGRAPISASLAAVLRGGEMEVRSLKVASDEVNVEASGTWTGLPAPGQLLRRERPLRSGSVTLRGSFAAADLSLLRALAGNPRRLEGRLAGEFSVAGPVADPAVDAEVRLDGGMLDRGGGLPPVERVALVAKVSGRTASIEQASGEAAGAPFVLGGDISWGKEGLRLDLTLTGKNLLLYRDERVTARADLDVRARGPLAKLRIEGAVSLQNSVYSRTVTLRELLGGGSLLRKRPRASGQLFSLRQAPWRDLEFGIDIGSGSPFLIKSNLARGAVRPELTLTGTGLLPVLSGNVFIDSTRLSLPGGTLVIDRGIVNFPQPGAGEPRIDLTGRTRQLGYDVTVVVGGALRAPEVTLTSVPPLPDDELLLLVLAGTPPGTADAQAMKSILEANLARFVAESVLGKVGGSGVSDLAERIEVEVGRNVTRSGAATIETRFRLAGGTGSTGRFLYLTGGSDIYDTYTMGVNVVFRFR